MSRDKKILIADDSADASGMILEQTLACHET